MKVLEVSTLHAGIDQVLNNVRNQREQLKQVDKSIQGIVNLEDSFKGMGGQAIRGYYDSYHLSFLQTLLAFYETYIETLDRAKTELNSFEPATNGFIRESFLEHEVANGLNQAKITTVSLADEANQIMNAVSDIVSLPQIDSSYVVQSIIRADNNRDLIIGQLYTFDQQQSSAFKNLEDTVQAMIQYVQQVSTLFQARNGSTPTIESVYFRQNILQPVLSSMPYLFSPSIQGKLNGWTLFYMNYSQHTLTYKVEYVKNSILKQNNDISEREIQALIRQSLDQVQVFDEFSTGTSEISGTYFVLPDGRILRKYHELNSSEIAYMFVDYIPVEQNSCEAPIEEEASFGERIMDFVRTSGDVVEGTGKGLYEVGEDLVTGVVDVVTNPGDTITGTIEAFRHPVQTFRAIESAISESYERDVVNGDAYSRANWFSYAVGTVATSVVGTKGLGAVGKTGVATTKSAAQTGIVATKNAIESSSIANLLPYAHLQQLAMAGDVPFNALNGVELKNQLISMAKVESVGKGAVESIKEAKGSVSGKGGSKSITNLLKETSCSDDALKVYLSKNVGNEAAEIFAKTGTWPDGVQIPKNPSVLNADGSINWTKAAEGGYTLDANGKAIKESFTPQMGEVIDRYGSSNGRYTSPVIDDNSYDYTQRSLPYVEDLSNYHQYEVVGDFSKIEEYVKKCPDANLKAQVDATVTAYYDGDYSKLLSHKGEAATVEGWGKGGAIQYEFSLTVEQLEGLGILKELK